MYSAAQFVEDVCPLIDDMHSRGKHQFWWAEQCYILNRCLGLADNLPNADQSIRDAIIAKADLEGWQSVYDELVSVDPIAGQKFKVFR